MNAREKVIPAGACVGAEAELFLELDRGEAGIELLEAGKLACGVCFQKPNCDINRALIGDELYELTGNMASFVGGRSVAATVDAPRSRVVPPAIKFNLSRLPEDPDLALMAIRRAVRARQFLSLAHTPPAVDRLARGFMSRVAEDDPELHGVLQQPPHMSRELVHRGVQHITATLFQQADFANVAEGKKTKHRYQDERVDPDAHYAITRLFVRDMLTLAGRGFQSPERQALVFSPEEYGQLEAVYLDNTISPSEFQYVLVHTINNPEKEFKDRLARLHFLRETQPPDVSESSLRQRARWHLDPEKIERGLSPNKAVNRRLTANDVLAIYTAADEGRTAVGFGGTIVETVLALRSQFGADLTLKHPATIARFGRLLTSEAIEVCTKIQAECSDALAERSRRGDVRMSEAYVRKYVVKHGYSSPESYGVMESAFVVDWLASRFRQRARLADVENNLPTWAVARTVALCEPDRVGVVAETLYSYSTEKPFLVPALSEMPLLQDANYRTDINTILDPMTGKYMTFSPALYRLQPSERLAFAHCTGMSPVLYGTNLDGDRIAALACAEDIEAYFTDCVLPHCEMLLQQPVPDGILPILLRQLSDDLSTLSSGWQGEQQLRQSSYFTTIVGGAALELGSRAINVDGGYSAMTTRLQQIVFERCRPYHIEVAADVQRAFEQGIIEVKSDTTAGVQIVFADYLREPDWQGQVYDEQQLAALAYCLGIDRLMFGHDLRDVLESRLEIGIVETAQPLMERIRQELSHSEAMNTSPFNRSDDFATPQINDPDLVPREGEPDSAPYMRRVEAGLYAERVLFTLSSLPPAEQSSFNLRGSDSVEQFSQELKVIADQGRAAQAYLFASLEDNIRILALSWAPRHLSASVTYDDLIQVGRLGALKALRRHDYKKGAALKTYAYSASDNEMKSTMAHDSSDIRLPASAHNQIKRIDGAETELIGQGKKLSEALVAERAGLSIKRYRELKQVSRPARVGNSSMLEVVVSASGALQNGAFTMDESTTETSELFKLVRRVILGPHPSSAASHRFQAFLYWMHGLGQTEIAQKLDMPIGTVKSSISRILVQLRESEEFRGYIFDEQGEG